MGQRKTAAAQTTTTEKDTAKIVNCQETAKNSTGNQHRIRRNPLLDNELAEVSSGNTNTDDIFIVKTANQWMEEAIKIPNPKPLWLSLWNEGELCCLFADSNVGKSIYAVQIATAISLNQNVLYFDFELTEKQFQLRYTNEKGSLYMFPDKLFRVEADPEKINLDNFENEVMGVIETLAKKYNSKVLIIDNITWLCATAEDGEMAGKLMKRLGVLKKKNGLSILVLAHTPKRDMSKPIIQNDLAGSKQILNFFDAAFSIGFSVWGNDYRYIKEIKSSRITKKTYGANNVINAIINKSEDGFTYFNTVGYGSESDHLSRATKARQKDNNSPEENDNNRRFFESILEYNKAYQYKDLLDIVMGNRKKSNGENYGSRSSKDYIKTAYNDGILIKVEGGVDKGKYKLSAKVQS